MLCWLGCWQLTNMLGNECNINVNVKKNGNILRDRIRNVYINKKLEVTSIEDKTETN